MFREHRLLNREYSGNVSRFFDESAQLILPSWEGIKNNPVKEVWKSVAGIGITIVNIQDEAINAIGRLLSRANGKEAPPVQGHNLNNNLAFLPQAVNDIFNPKSPITKRITGVINVVSDGIKDIINVIGLKPGSKPATSKVASALQQAA